MAPVLGQQPGNLRNESQINPGDTPTPYDGIAMQPDTFSPEIMHAMMTLPKSMQETALTKGLQTLRYPEIYRRGPEGDITVAAAALFALNHDIIQAPRVEGREPNNLELAARLQFIEPILAIAISNVHHDHHLLPYLIHIHHALATLNTEVTGTLLANSNAHDYNALLQFINAKLEETILPAFKQSAITRLLNNFGSFVSRKENWDLLVWETGSIHQENAQNEMNTRTQSGDRKQRQVSGRQHFSKRKTQRAA